MVKGSFNDNGSFDTLIQWARDAQGVGTVVGQKHRQGLNEAENIMHDTVHKITGHLDSTIKQQNVTDTHGEIVVTASYAALEEYRAGNHSYFRPGVQHYKDTVPEAISQDVSNYLQSRRGQATISRNNVD